MDRSQKRKLNQRPPIVLVVGAVVVSMCVNSGCSLLSSKKSPAVPEAEAFTSNVSTNANEMPLPVEINNDIGKIAAGGGHFDSNNGKVNVNVNVNFNGSGWTSNVPVKVSGYNPNGQAPQQRDVASTDAATNSSAVFDAKSSVPGERRRREGLEKYVVKPGDTLMKISFEKFGSVYRWREILASNKSRIANFSSLVPGTELTIDGVDYVVVEKNGTPYLIVRNDTLGKISRKVYGEKSFWRNLWKNNPQLIHNPNKIYTGFTLYYRDKSALGTPITVGKAGVTKVKRKRLPASPRKANQ